MAYSGIDTPGLDADIRGKDDRLARLGADELADYLFLVHNIKTGELDRSELDLYQKMMARYPDSKNRMVLVLTQIDQLSPAEGERVNQIIQAQLPGITVIPVSALRYQRGIAEGREKFIELSGITRLLARTKQLKKRPEGQSPTGSEASAQQGQKTVSTAPATAEGESGRTGRSPAREPLRFCQCP